MPVFKLCMKIIKKNIPTMLIYIFVFLLVSILISTSSTKDQEKLMNQSKTNIAFISDENSVFINGLKDQLGTIANFVNIEDNTEALQDALYFRSVEYIIRVPKGFTDDFMSGKDVQLEKTIVPASISNAYIDLSINQYLSTAKLYINQVSGISQETLVQHLKTDLNKQTQVELLKTATDKGDTNFTKYYVNYLSYSLLSVILLGIGTIMMVFNNSDIKRRTGCSPLSPRNITIQYILANLMLALVTWIIMIVACLIINYKNTLNISSLYFLLNSFVFTVCCVSIGFLVGKFVKNQNAISAACNVITLGSCFISGVFVPQELLSDSVLKMASFTPTYWYVKANNVIAELSQFDYSHVSTVLSYMLIEMVFALSFFAVTLVVGKKGKLQH